MVKERVHVCMCIRLDMHKMMWCTLDAAFALCNVLRPTDYASKMLILLLFYQILLLQQPTLAHLLQSLHAILTTQANSEYKKGMLSSLSLEDNGNTSTDADAGDDLLDLLDKAG